jgi:hypothetical protein
MPDKRALKLIGIMFAALTLAVISTAAVVVAGHAASSVTSNSKLVDLRDQFARMGDAVCERDGHCRIRYEYVGSRATLHSTRG